MALFRVIYALHFALGIFVALRLWPFTLAIFGLLSNQSIAFQDFGLAASTSVLTVLWYFVWYGSIKFAVRGSFPMVSIRFFAALTAAVYLGAAWLAGVMSGENLIQLAGNRPAMVGVVLTMLALAIATALWLPGIKRSWDVERERLARVRDERLDQNYRIENPRTRD